MPWEIAAASRLQAGGSVYSVVGSDVIFIERRGQSQKPEEFYELVEVLVPQRPLSRAARAQENNLREFLDVVARQRAHGHSGLPPPEDLAAMAARGRPVRPARV